MLFFHTKQHHGTIGHRMHKSNIKTCFNRWRHRGTSVCSRTFCVGSARMLTQKRSKRWPLATCFFGTTHTHTCVTHACATLFLREPNVIVLAHPRPPRPTKHCAHLEKTQVTSRCPVSGATAAHAETGGLDSTSKERWCARCRPIAWRS